MQAIAHRYEQLEDLPSGEYRVKRHECILPGETSKVIIRHLRAVESQQSLSWGLWRYQYHEIEQLKAAREALRQTYKRFGHWQSIIIALALIFGVAHGVAALMLAANIAHVVPVGGSALLFGGGFASMLRYLAKERAAAMNGFTQLTKRLAACQSTANDMITSVSR